MVPLTALKEHYHEILNSMPAEFDSHQFILALAQTYQPEYVSTLFSYVNVRDRGVFRALHSQIAQSLHEYADYVRDVTSSDIFGNAQSNALWRKRNIG